MGIEDDVTFLARVPTLTLLGRDALRILAIGAESRYVHYGDVLFLEGDTADGGFVVQEGSFTLSAERTSFEGGPVRVGTGSLIGELALVTETRRPATATANEPSAVLCIPRKLFLKMLDGYPAAAQRLRAAFASRAEQAIEDINVIRPVFDVRANSARARDEEPRTTEKHG